jgi:hypothetical protein
MLVCLFDARHGGLSSVQDSEGTKSPASAIPCLPSPDWADIIRVYGSSGVFEIEGTIWFNR